MIASKFRLENKLDECVQISKGNNKVKSTDEKLKKIECTKNKLTQFYKVVKTSQVKRSKNWDSSSDEEPTFPYKKNNLRSNKRNQEIIVKNNNDKELEEAKHKNSKSYEENLVCVNKSNKDVVICNKIIESLPCFNSRSNIQKQQTLDALLEDDKENIDTNKENAQLYINLYSTKDNNMKNVLSEKQTDTQLFSTNNRNSLNHVKKIRLWNSSSDEEKLDYINSLKEKQSSTNTYSTEKNEFVIENNQNLKDILTCIEIIEPNKSLNKKSNSKLKLKDESLDLFEPFTNNITKDKNNHIEINLSKEEDRQIIHSKIDNKENTFDEIIESLSSLTKRYNSNLKHKDKASSITPFDLSFTNSNLFNEVNKDTSINKEHTQTLDKLTWNSSDKDTNMPHSKNDSQLFDSFNDKSCLRKDSFSTHNNTNDEAAIPKTFSSDHSTNNSSVINSNSKKELISLFNSTFRKDLLPKDISDSQNVTTTQQNNELNSQLSTADLYIKKTKDDNTNTFIRNILDDEDVKLLLTQEYKKYKKKEKETIAKNKSCIKRYRKGKMKIYRLKKLKKPNSNPQINATQADLSIEAILNHMTQSYIDTESTLNRSDSTDSVSTSSSYITDETTSETSSTCSEEFTPAQLKIRSGLNDLVKDKNLLPKNEKVVNFNKNVIKEKIQDIFFNVYTGLTTGGKAVLSYKTQTLQNCVFRDGRMQFRSDAPKMTKINSDSSLQQKNFKLILFILKKVYNLLDTNTRLTKRELYYQMKHLMSNQRVMDCAINEVSCILDVGMWALNIVAQKGLVFGDLKILLSSGETMNCKVPGTLIPQNIEDIAEIHSTAYFILVIEKESVFHKLIEDNLINKLTRPFIMITGKGFPDLNTQLFLKKLWTVMSIPVFIMVDADPDGVKIMLNYRFGSIKNAHVSHHLATTNAKWLGVYPSEVNHYLDIESQPLTPREIKLTQTLLKLPCMDENPGIAAELQVMLKNNCKAGIEAFMKTDEYLSQIYLPIKFSVNKFI